MAQWGGGWGRQGWPSSSFPVPLFSSSFFPASLTFKKKTPNLFWEENEDALCYDLIIQQNITQKIKWKRSSSALKWAKKMNEEEKLQFLVPMLQCWKVILIERNEFHSKSWFYYTPSSTHWTLHILHPIREWVRWCFMFFECGNECEPIISSSTLLSSGQRISVASHDSSS